MMLWQIVTLALSFIGGFFTGYFIRGLIEEQVKGSFKDELVLISVTLIFVMTSIVSLIRTDFDVPIPLYGLMGGIVGYFFKKETDEKKSD